MQFFWHRLELFFVKVKLALHLAGFSLSLLANISNKTKPLIVLFFIFGVVGVTSGIAMLHAQQTPKTMLVTAPIPQNPQEYELHTLTQEELQERLAFWQKLAQLQPDSRDILLNLAQLNEALGDTTQAQEYKTKAVSLDPNGSF